MARGPKTKPIRRGRHTILSKMRLLKQMGLGRSQMRQSMGLYRASRASCSCSRRHPAHHRSTLGDLRSARRRYPGVDLLNHSGPGMGIRVLTGGHRVTRRKAMVLRNALMGRKRLRHHHRCTTKSPITGLLPVGIRGLEGERGATDGDEEGEGEKDATRG